jgi:hypothetical protein
MEERTMLGKLATLVLLVTISSVAAADCIYQGQPYPNGTAIGPLVCTKGKWVMR